MASLKTHTNARNWYVKDYDPISGKSYELNTAIPKQGETDSQTAMYRKRAETYLKRHLKSPKRRMDTATLLRKQAERRISVSLNESIETYLKAKSKSVKIKKQTLTDYKRQLSYLISQFGEEKRLGLLTFGELESLRDFLADSRTPAGVDGIFRGIKAFIRWSYAEYELNNLHKIIWRFGELKVAVGNRKPKKRVVTDEEFKLVIFYVDDQTEFGHLCKTYFKFARATGRRLTEICKGYINGQIWYYGAKGDDDQALFLKKNLIQKWLTIQEYLPKDEDGLISETDLHRFTNRITYAFTTAMRKAVLNNDVGFLKEFGYLPVDLLNMGRTRTAKLSKKLLLRRYAKMYNMTMKDLSESDKRIALKRIPSFHSLRHSIVTEMVREKGVEYTRAFIGHSNSKTTEGYTHISQVEVSRRYFENN